MKYSIVNAHSSCWKDINNWKKIFYGIQHLSPCSGMKKKSIVVNFLDNARFGR